MQAQLMPLDGGPPIPLLKDLTVVGRKEDCDLRLNHKSISKMHCVIVKTDGLLMLRDLGSTNGTRVNGQRVRRAHLLPNDQLGIANFKFRVHLGPDQPAPIAPAEARRHEHTHLAVDEELAARARKKSGDDSDDEKPALPFQRNNLPDVYGEDVS